MTRSKNIKIQQSILATLISDRYNVNVINVEPLHVNNDKRGTFRIVISRTISWVLRISCHADANRWFSAAAATLISLTHSDYVTPEVIYTEDGHLVGQYGDWFFYVTTYIEGSLADFSLSSLSILASSLGELHAKTHTKCVSATPSWWALSNVALQSLEQLFAIEQQVPYVLQPLHKELVDSLHFIYSTESLSRSIIHGDCRPSNAIISHDQLIMIDWDWSGSGLKIIDVANILINCHIEQPLDQDFTPDEKRINAVVTGYSRFSELNDLDLAKLSDAIRFSIAAPNAQRLIRAVQGAITKDIWIEKLQVRFARSEQISYLAYKAFEGVRSAML